MFGLGVVDHLLSGYLPKRISGAVKERKKQIILRMMACYNENKRGDNMKVVNENEEKESVRLKGLEPTAL